MSPTPPCPEPHRLPGHLDGCPCPGPPRDASGLPAAATIFPLCTTRPCTRPTWHFSVQMKMPRALVDKYGLGAYVYAADQLAQINQRFNAAAAFSGDVSFDLADFT